MKAHLSFLIERIKIIVCRQGNSYLYQMEEASIKKKAKKAVPAIMERSKRFSH